MLTMEKKTNNKIPFVFDQKFRNLFLCLSNIKLNLCCFYIGEIIPIAEQSKD